MVTDRRKTLVVSLVGVALSMPLLLDMMFAFSGTFAPIILLIQLFWFISLLMGIVAMTKAWSAREDMRLAFFCLMVPVVVFVLGWLPILPLFMMWLHMES